MQALFNAFTRLPGSMGILLLLAWGGLFGGLFLLHVPSTASLEEQLEQEWVNNPPEIVLSEAFETPLESRLQLLELECETFNFPRIPLFRMRKILEEYWDIQLHVPPSRNEMVLEGQEYRNRSLAYILTDLLRPRDLGFFQEGKDLYLTEMETRLDSPQEGTEDPFRRHIKTTIKTGGAEPADLWLDNAPLISLSITALPLFSEVEQADKVGLSLECRRNQQMWFQHFIETRLNEPWLLEVQDQENLYCRLVPLSVSGQQIHLEVEFAYDKPVAAQ